MARVYPREESITALQTELVFRLPRWPCFWSYRQQQSHLTLEFLFPNHAACSAQSLVQGLPTSLLLCIVDWASMVDKPFSRQNLWASASCRRTGCCEGETLIQGEPAMMNRV